MSDIYDINVSSMKIGVAVPVVNNSFRFWTDAGTWASPKGWTVSNLTASRDWTGFDADDAGLQIDGSSVPNDTTFNIESSAQRFCNDNRDLDSTQQFYYNFAYNVAFTTPGANRLVNISLALDDNAAFSSPAYYSLATWTSDSAAGYNLTSGTRSSVSGVSVMKYAAVRIYMADAAAITAKFDCIGLMYNPLDYSAYYELTKVFATNGPPWHDNTFGKITKTPLGTSKTYDPSGGARKLILALELRNESTTTYETLKRFYDINRGTPGLPGLPLAIEPNLPGLPPMLVGNITNPEFGLTRQPGGLTRWGGQINFETVW